MVIYAGFIVLNLFVIGDEAVMISSGYCVILKIMTVS